MLLTFVNQTSRHPRCQAVVCDVFTAALRAGVRKTGNDLYKFMCASGFVLLCMMYFICTQVVGIFFSSVLNAS